MSRELDLVAVWKAPGEAAASIIKAHLESCGIPALLKYESLGNVLGVLVNGLGEVSVMVPGRFAGEAKRIIDEDDSGSGI